LCLTLPAQNITMFERHHAGSARGFRRNARHAILM